MRFVILLMKYTTVMYFVNYIVDSFVRTRYYFTVKVVLMLATYPNFIGGLVDDQALAKHWCGGET
jgi:hypothetical protein